MEVIFAATDEALADSFEAEASIFKPSSEKVEEPTKKLDFSDHLNDLFYQISKGAWL